MLNFMSIINFIPLSEFRLGNFPLSKKCFFSYYFADSGGLSKYIQDIKLEDWYLSLCYNSTALLILKYKMNDTEQNIHVSQYLFIGRAEYSF